MVSQVMVVGILMIVQGVLALLTGLMFVASGVLNFAVHDTGDMEEAERIGFMVGLIGASVVMGLAGIIPGVLNIWGGIRALQFRSRGVVLAGVFSNAAAILTCYCIPTSLTVLVYGAIVMLNGDVARAFRLGEEGMSPAQIRNRFAPNRGMTGFDEDDDDFDRP